MLRKIIIISFALIFLCVGCSNDTKKIILEMADENGDFKESLEILDKDQVSIINKILTKVKWKEKSKESFGLLKFRMSFDFIDPDKELKSSYYLIYVNSKEQVTLVENDMKYTKLSKEESKELLEILANK
ncbi:hypothetical protein J2D69_08640 [Lysinibacillus sphaericus]|uniref:Uncharacterized protein n=3 Tax=Lysinibacillus TaxID=400634 RepID=B1HV36_LYSSC|nr:MULTISPECIES: hypothetical protein [Lysinibacillus]MBE5082202.1 hypothetical protein [Bacillus thuringiensis]ACA39747.1 hypothetical protein Bsph_2176 [Lysinibacillus sphaericus C3-41]AMO34124.1 hypothetical protein AR327_17640 [Lysinibacillus sphaericus]AMR90766.1 hypothetical protein A1T07_11565 [Lysinibacillus sphaericus]ANA44816.1 hypothetical protein A2J09_04235 [Lysinibacillus sphaericus]